MAEAETKNGDAKLIETALKRFQRCVDAESENRSRALEDIKFANGEQWDEAVRAQRQLEGRPCLTINRVMPFIRQVTNEQRQNRPAIKVLPVDSKADPDTAEIFNGIARHIEVASNAESAYDTAFEASVKGGWGYFRILTEYANDKSFDQDIRIKRIINAFTVYLDPDIQEADGSDAKFGFVVEDVRREEFEAQYPDADPCGFDDVKGKGDSMAWATEDTVRVAEYFYIHEEKVTIYLLADGSVVEEVPAGQKAVKSRDVKMPRVKWCKITCKEALEKQDFPSRYIPLIPVYGDETHMDGERILSGLTRVLRDPQQAYNFFYTATAETVGLAPKSQFVMAEGQDEGHENEWANANQSSSAALVYKPVNIDGVLAPPPQRQAPVQVPTGLMQLMLQAGDDMKAVSGIYDAALGNKSNETSGRAIVARNRQSDTATFHYLDNLSRAIRHCGRVVVDMIPKVYDSARIARIVGIDGEPDMVPVNQQFEEKPGIQKIYRLGVGTYDVTVTTGPSYQTRRQESSETMVQLAQGDPTLMQKAGDLIVKQMDFPGADELSKRLKVFLPPEAQDESEDNPVPPQIKAQMQQMEKAIQDLSAALEQAHKEVDEKDNSAAVKNLELKFREEALSLKEQLAKAQNDYAKAELQADQKVYEANIKSIIDDGLNKLEMMVNQARTSAEVKAAQLAATPDAEFDQDEAALISQAMESQLATTAGQLQSALAGLPG